MYTVFGFEMETPDMVYTLYIYSYTSLATKSFTSISYYQITLLRHYPSLNSGPKMTVGSTDATTNSSTNNASHSMLKSMSSNSGELENCLSLSNSLALTALQLKRTYLYALVSASSKTVTFYGFTTDNTTHDSLKLLLEQTYETILQRYNLANNTVLYKFGGLIGDSLIYDLKKVKTLTLSATQLEIASRSDPLGNEEAKSKRNSLFMSESSPSSMMSSKKLSSSPKFHRHLSYKSPSESNNAHPINTSLITNLQFSGAPGSNSSSYQSNSLLPVPNSLSSLLAFKQIYMNSSGYKAYDNIINIVNQQISFCAQYLTGTANSLTFDLASSLSMLSTSYSNFNFINR